jgi:hypothetical protein
VFDASVLTVFGRSDAGQSGTPISAISKMSRGSGLFRRNLDSLGSTASVCVQTRS